MATTAAVEVASHSVEARRSPHKRKQKDSTAPRKIAATYICKGLPMAAMPKENSSERVHSATGASTYRFPSERKRLLLRSTAALTSKTMTLESR